MIVKFSTRHGQIILLGECAAALLALAGHSGAVPGAVLRPELPAFLARLRAGLEIHGDELSPPRAELPADERDEEERRDRPAAVTLRKRAVPLVDLLETAIARGSDLMWERG